MELECDWLEEVVAALSWENPLWLDSRLVMEPLRVSPTENRSEDCPEMPIGALHTSICASPISTCKAGKEHKHPTGQIRFLWSAHR